MRPTLLDLFCGAGGAAEGYHRAGFNIIGVDLHPQPNYPFEFFQADALEFMEEALDKFYPFNYVDAIHASPPCQAYSTTSSLHDASHPELVEPVRLALQTAGVPYVIENVVGAPLINPVRLCGSSFGLNVWRHRLFECSFDVGMVPPCSHHEHPKPLDVTGTGGPGGRHRKPSSLAQGQEAMGIDWMTRRELSQSIPPAYTEFIGQHLMAAVGREQLAA